jgi:hypothetical protein
LPSWSFPNVLNRATGFFAAASTQAPKTADKPPNPAGHKAREIRLNP